MAGTSSAIEILQSTPDGGLLAAGIVDAPQDGLEGFKSYGNPFGGKAALMYFSSEQVQADSPPNAPTWSRVYDDSLTVKGARVVPDDSGGFILLTANQDEIATLIRTDDQGAVQWTKTYLGRGEPTDVSVLLVDDVVDGFAFVGHGGDGGTLDGYLTKVTVDGTIAWTKAFGDPVGGVGQFAGLGTGNPKLIYDECWGIQGTPDGGMVTGCGTGIEGCEPWPMGSAIKAECEEDPRTVWRGMVTKFDATGQQVWQRVDSFQPPEDPEGEEVGSSASEYVALTADGGLLSVVDEGFGIGVMVLAADGTAPGNTGSDPGATTGAGGNSGAVGSDTVELSGCRMSDARRLPSRAAWWTFLIVAALVSRRHRAGKHGAA